MRDFQKSKLYAWENAVVEPAPISRYLSSALNYSWMGCGFLWGFRGRLE